MTDAVYRFMPWSRRGLASAVPALGDGDSLPSRPTVKVELVVAGVAGTVETSTGLYGPGDVIGLDTTSIVRTTPRPNSTNVEPNYLAAVDFDQPELPWLFTPTGAPRSGHLRPWLVLVVIRDRPEVSISTGGILPQITIESGAATDLPDLDHSWAWAHVQLLDEDAGSTPTAVGQALADHPDRNVSRLVCPRRLEPNTSWIACLVPAFDAGVARGLGGEPQPGNLAPAWTQQPDSITLPMYYFWRCQTGAQGDFESLARRLKPYEAEARIGRVKMHVGDASPFVNLPNNDPSRFLDQDGALQAPKATRNKAQPPMPDPTLADVPTALRTGLQEVTRVLADAADGKLDGQVPGTGEALGPPVYTGAHVRRNQVVDNDDTWFRELNTDPRCRVAAGLGADVLRKYQEDVMEAAWQQVGNVLGLETALSRARLSLEVSLRFRARHLEPLPEGKLLQLTAPLASHTLLDGLTLPAKIAPTSLPDLVTDPAMRRYTAATGRVLAGIRRHATKASVQDAARAAGDKLVTSLAKGRRDVDPTRFPALALNGLPDTLPDPLPDGTVPLDKLGIRVDLDATAAAQLARASRELTRAPAISAAEMLQPRPDLRDTGLITTIHLLAARDVAVVQLDELADSGNHVIDLSETISWSTSAILDILLDGVILQPDAVGYLLETGQEVNVLPLALQADGVLVVVTGAGVPNVPIAQIDPRLGGSGADLGNLLTRLPRDTFERLRGPDGRIRPRRLVDIRPGAGPGGIDVIRRMGTTPTGPVPGPGLPGPGPVLPGPGPVLPGPGPVLPGPGPVLPRPGPVLPRPGPVLPRPGPVAPGIPGPLPLPPLVKDPVVIDRFVGAIGQLVELTSLAIDPVVPELVSFALPRAATATLESTNPLTVHPARLDTMIRIADHTFLQVLADATLTPTWQLAPLFDRVMTYPRFDLPAYTYLAAYDRTRFCPGVDAIPPESITLLETNPRFIAAFMAGLNHETNLELLWRSYPTEGRGTPWRKFWQREDGGPDIIEIHTWRKRGQRDDLPAQTVDPRGNLVLMLRGDLLRRYPNTQVIAVRAVRDDHGAQTPSKTEADVRLPVFAGQFDPDVSFFGFALVSADLTAGEGWFFGLMEPVTEPRFGFDETIGTPQPTTWNDVAWPDLDIPHGGLLTPAHLAALDLSPPVGQADGVAAALFQRPFKLIVHARHLVQGI